MAKFLYKHKRKGLSLLEYGLIGSLVAVSVLTSVSNTGKNVRYMYCNIARNIIDTGICPKVVPDQFSGRYLTISEGGTINPDETYRMWHTELATLTAATLKSINANDPITSIQGIFTSDKQQLSTYDDASEYLTQDENNGKTLSAPDWYVNDSTDPSQQGGSGIMQVQGKSGTVYTVNFIDQNGSFSDGTKTSDPQSFYYTVTDSSGKLVETNSVVGNGITNGSNITIGKFKE